MNPHDRDLICSLIKEFSNDNGTESLIGFIADNNGMLAACKDLFGVEKAINHSFLDWINLECKRYNVSYTDFSRGISLILSILGGQSSENDNYSILGLVRGASEREVKAAYRRLSLQYHPDRASKGQDDNPERFIEITQAYHAITKENKKELGKNTKRNESTAWVWTTNRNFSSIHKKHIIIGVMGLLSILFVSIVVGSFSVRKKAMIAGLEEDRSGLNPIGVTQNSPSLNRVQDQEGNDKPLIGTRTGSSNGSDVVSAGKKKLKVSSSRETQDNKVDYEYNKTAKTYLNEAHPTTSTDEVSFQPIETNIAQPFEGTKQLKATKRKRLATKEKKNAEGTNELKVLAPNFISYDKDEKKGIKSEENKKTYSNDLLNNSVDPDQIALNQEEKLDLTTKDNSQISTKIYDKKNTQIVDFQKRIDDFIRNYETAYSQRNIEQFSQYFLPGATENDKPFTDMVAIYSELFNSTTDVSLSINVLSWNKSTEGIQLNGRFKVYLRYLNGKEIVNTGRIFLLLDNNLKNLLVKTSEYFFDK